MKRLKKLLAGLCMAALVVLTAAGCGSDKPYKTVQDYLDDNSDDMKAAEEATKGTGMTMKITADGSKLVYTVQYETQLPVDETNKDALKGEFETAMEGQRSSLESTLDELKKQIDDENVSIVFSYLNADGTLLYSDEIK